MKILLAATRPEDFLGSDSVSLSKIQSLPNPISSLLNSPNPLNALLQLTINLLFLGAVLLAFIFIVFAGYKLLVSQGDKKEIETARSIFFQAIVGLIVVFFSFLFINLIGSFFHLTLFQTTIK